MAKSVDQFFADYEGKGIDFDGVYGKECVDVVEQYFVDVLGIPAIKGNAIDYWTHYPQDHFERIENTPTNFPQKSDIVIWNLGQFGHIAVAREGDVNKFVSFDQNYPTQGYIDNNGNFIGTGVAHFQIHNYQGVLGWLRPKQLTKPAFQSTVTVTGEEGANVRKSPEIAGIKVILLQKGTVCAFNQAVTGETFKGNNIWYQLTDNNYVWSGNLSIPTTAPQPTPPPPPKPGEPGSLEYDQSQALATLKAFVATHGGNLEGASKALVSFWETNNH